MTELEKVARFIAQYRTVIAKSSVEKINMGICWLGLEGSKVVAEQLRAMKSKIEEVANNEDIRYAELMEQNVLAQLQAIQGVKSVHLYADEKGQEYLGVDMQAYYLYNGRIYDAGYWKWYVPMANATNNIVSPCFVDTCHLEDGTVFHDNEASLRGMFVGIGEMDSAHPLYSDCNGFCFGTMARDIDNYIKVGDFVSAFQLVSLCLHHVNECDRDKIPFRFKQIEGVKIRDMAEYFGLSEEEVAKIETMLDEAEKGKQLAKELYGRGDDDV